MIQYNNWVFDNYHKKLKNLCIYNLLVWLMPICKICGGEYPPEEMVGDICVNCASAMMQKDGIDLGLGIEG